MAEQIKLMDETMRGELKRWQLDAAAAAESSESTGPLVPRLLAARGLVDEEAVERFLNPRLVDLHDPAAIPNLEKAAGRIIEALQQDEPIAIYGDYDVDGVTATSILYHVLAHARPERPPTRYIPHRIEEGYGLNEQAIRQLAEAGHRLIISVDCGITAIGPAQVARELGVDLIITDHHEMTDSLPEAWTIVHPRLHEHPDAGIEGPGYPWGELCGAGVAYKLAWSIARHWCGSERVSGSFRELLVDLLSLAALGTVADVVPLQDENRTIVRYGLTRIKDTPFAGLNALIDAADLRRETIDAYHVGFILGPRLNACGRMGHASRACDLLTILEGSAAGEAASFLDAENRRRQTTERAIVREAEQLVMERGYDQPNIRTIILAEEGWHAGVVGIVCSRLVERFGRPVILLNLENGQAVGSGRSIDGYDLHAALAACSEHLSKWGGHAMAAGMTVEAESVEAFRQAMLDYAIEHLPESMLTPSVTIHATASLDELSVRTMRELERLAPFGRGNPRPTLLIPRVTLAQHAECFGRNANHLRLIVRSGSTVCRCLAWQRGEHAPTLRAGQPLDLVAHPKLNTYRGQTTVELEILDWRKTDASA